MQLQMFSMDMSREIRRRLGRGSELRYAWQMLVAERSEMDSRNAPSDEDQKKGQQRAEVSVEERELLLISHSAGWPRLAQRLNAFCLPPCRQLIEIAKSSIHSFITTPFSPAITYLCH